MTTELIVASDRPSPLLIKRLQAFAMLGIGPTMGHALIKARLLDARKMGGKTLITMESIKALAVSLPRSTALSGDQ